MLICDSNSTQSLQRIPWPDPSGPKAQPISSFLSIIVHSSPVVKPSLAQRCGSHPISKPKRQKQASDRASGTATSALEVAAHARERKESGNIYVSVVKGNNAGGERMRECGIKSMAPVSSREISLPVLCCACCDVGDLESCPSYRHSSYRVWEYASTSVRAM